MEKNLKILSSPKIPKLKGEEASRRMWKETIKNSDP